MSDQDAAGPKAGISTRTMEVAVALALLAVSALVVFDSYRLGARWGDDGPQSGYFPFYIGLLLGLSSLATLARVALKEWRRGDQFRGAIAERRESIRRMGAAQARDVRADPRPRVRAGGAAHRHLRRVRDLHHAVHAPCSATTHGRRAPPSASPSAHRSSSCSRSGSRFRCSRAPSTRSRFSATERSLLIRIPGRSLEEFPWSRSVRSFTASRSCCRRSTCC